MAGGMGMLAIGTGLGGFLTGYDQAKQRAQQQQMNELRMQQARQEQQDRARQQQAQSMAFSGLLGLDDMGGSLPGATPAQSFDPGGGDTDTGQAMPRQQPQQRYSAPPADSGFRSGLPGSRPAGGDPGLRQLAQFAPFPTQGRTGAQPDERQLPWTNTQPPDEVQRSAVGPGAPTAGPVSPASFASAPPPRGAAPGVNFPGAGETRVADAGMPAIPPELHQQSRQTAQQTVQMIDPSVRGRMALSAMARQIDKANPGADPVAKMLAIEHLSKLLAPSEQRAWEMLKEQNHEKFQMLLQDRQDIRLGRREEAAAERQERGIIAGEQRQEQRDIAAERRQDKRLGSGSGRASRNVEVTDADGKIIFSGSAHQGAEGWIADKDQKPIEVPDNANIKILGTGGQGRQAAAQIQSMIGSTTEIVGEARNLMDLPSTSVAGIFQGLQAVPGPDLGQAMARSLANKLTAEDATDLATSFQGVARALATIEAQGRATGLVGLTGMSQGLMPQTGDTMGNVLRKYATIRQIVERNTEAIEASPNVSVEQKNLLKRLRAEMAEVIPFTVPEVNKLQHGDVETYRQAAKKFGLSGGAAGQQQQGAGGYKEGDTATNPQTGEKMVFRGGQWVAAEARTPVR